MKKVYLVFILTNLLIVACASKKEGEKKQIDVVSMSESAVEKDVGPLLNSYIVKKGDTLMWVAFKLYGDFTKWRELKDQNPEVNINNLSIGSMITYIEPEEKFIWNKNGNPYLIQKGDTLGTISEKVYKTKTKWRALYENNQQMIKDPSIIFAGFTLYYKPIKELAQSSF